MTNKDDNFEGGVLIVLSRGEISLVNPRAEQDLVALVNKHKETLHQAF